VTADYEAIRAENERRYGTDVGRYGTVLLAVKCDDRTHLIFDMLQNSEDALASAGAIQSMSGTGRCYDNARMESFFATLKKEKPYRIDTTKVTRDQVKSIIFRYIHYYNRRRIYSTNDGLPPLRKREQYYITELAA
jgi:putative transposase